MFEYVEFELQGTSRWARRIGRWVVVYMGQEVKKEVTAGNYEHQMVMRLVNPNRSPQTCPTVINDPSISTLKDDSTSLKVFWLSFDYRCL